MSANPNTWEFADKPDCDLLLDVSLDFEPGSKPELPVYAVICYADSEPLPAEVAGATVEPTPANRSLDNEDDVVDMATGQPPPPPDIFQPFTNAEILDNHAHVDLGE